MTPAPMLADWLRSLTPADKTHRGYYRSDLEDPWGRYLPARKASEASEASEAPPTCLTCGLPMPYGDLCGDGRHPNCGAIS